MSNLVTLSRLGRMGRWGNQVFQYAFIRSYARTHGINYEVPRWIGQHLYGHDDPLLANTLPSYMEDREDGKYVAAQGYAFPPSGDAVVGHDFVGYAQFHTKYYQPNRDFIASLFQLTPDKQARFDAPVAQLRAKGKTVVGLHLRRGDTGRQIFYLTPNQWYLDWLNEYWPHLDDPVLFIATETPSDVEAFAEYNPVTSTGLLSLTEDPYEFYNYLLPDMRAPTSSSMDWFPDWYFLTQCDILAIGNSTFGFTAAMMAKRLCECWRSRLSTQRFELINPWDEWPLTREDLRDFPGIPGTWYDTNEFWNGGEMVRNQ